MIDVPEPLVVHVLLLTHDDFCMIYFASLILGYLIMLDPVLLLYSPKTHRL
jgi:hypothetical protein